MSREKNPVEEYLTEKTAGFDRAVGAGLARGLRGGAGPLSAMPSAYRAANVGGRIAGHVGTAALTAAGAGVVGGLAFGGQKLYDVATKSRDFRSMLEANPELARQHQENPRLVNQMFSTLRTFNPMFTKDPIVASHYVSHMVEDPAHAGSVATEALNFRDKVKTPLTDMATRAAFQSAQKPIGK